MSRKNFTSITHIIAHINRAQGLTSKGRVPKPSAQTFDSCDGHPEHVDLKATIKTALNHWEKHYPIIYHFALLQIYSGARVSEILKVHSYDITPDSRILIRSLKGGNDRTIQMPIDHTWLQSERIKGRYLFMDLSRFVIHRQYVGQGIAAHFGNNQKRSTTHLFRHLVGLDLKTLRDETHAIKTGLGQKTDQATDHYKTKIRRKNN